MQKQTHRTNAPSPPRGHAHSRANWITCTHPGTSTPPYTSSSTHPETNTPSHTSTQAFPKFATLQSLSSPSPSSSPSSSPPHSSTTVPYSTSSSQPSSSSSPSPESPSSPQSSSSSSTSTSEKAYQHNSRAPKRAHTEKNSQTPTPSLATETSNSIPDGSQAWGRHMWDGTGVWGSHMEDEMRKTSMPSGGELTRPQKDFLHTCGQLVQGEFGLCDDAHDLSCSSSAKHFIGTVSGNRTPAYGGHFCGNIDGTTAQEYA